MLQRLWPFFTTWIVCPSAFGVAIRTAAMYCETLTIGALTPPGTAVIPGSGVEPAGGFA